MNPKPLESLNHFTVPVAMSFHFLRSFEPLRPQMLARERPIELDPRRRVVARLGKTAHPRIHAGVHQARRELLAEQQVIDAQPRVALPVLAAVIPEPVTRFVRMPLA